MNIRFEALPTEPVRALQQGGTDSYGNLPERRIADGGHIPCRHCLTNIMAGDPYLIVAWRPFGALQPYAETGPIFLHADACDRAVASQEAPPMLLSPEYIVRGYDSDERIIYGTGGIVPTAAIAGRARELLENPDIAFVHVRSSRNNCFQFRIDRE